MLKIQREKAVKNKKEYNERVNDLFKKLNLPLENKVQMDHYGRAYLFGQKIDVNTSNEELIKIIKSTSEENWNGKIGFSGAWKEKIMTKDKKIPEQIKVAIKNI